MLGPADLFILGFLCVIVLGVVIVAIRAVNVGKRQALVVIGTAVFMFGLLVCLRWQWHRQVDAIARVKRMGGKVETEPVCPNWLRGVFGERVMAGYDGVSSISLKDTQVTIGELEQLSQFSSLSHLYLSRTTVTDAGLVQLKKLANFQRLGLSGTLITDAGIQHLRGLTKLQSLDLKNTQVTDAGVRDLQTALPKCFIYRK